jgi:hypothetical protein
MASEIYGEARKGSGRIEQGEGNRIRISYPITFRVVSDNPFATREEILLDTPGLPIVGLLYGPFQLVCKSKQAERSETHRNYWEVTCEFESGKEEQEQDPDNPSDDPTTWIPQFKVDSFITKERVMTKDKTPASDGNVNFGVDGPYFIRNSAGQVFETPLTEQFTLAQFSGVQFEDSSLSLLTIMQRNNSVNSATFNGFAARTLLLELASAELGTWGNYRAWRIGYRFTYDPDTHDVPMLDVGTSYLDGTTLKPYMDETDMFRIIGNLDGTGDKASGDPAILKFQRYPQINFSSFLRM